MNGTSNRVALEQGRLYSMEEVAEWLGVSYQLVQKLVRAGELPAVKVGVGKRRLIRIKEEDLKVLVSHPVTTCKEEKEKMEA
jgi:excisionase family DNA binding protein